MARVRLAHRSAWLLAAALVLLAAAPGLALNADLKANRTSGVAPLAVFFDAKGTSHPDGKINEFHDLNYDFDFGDPNAGNWGETSGNAFLARQSKNEYHGGPLAGHVYEKPGTYIARVKATDGKGNSSTARVTITVQDPDSVFSGSKTVCYANAGSNFNGCPGGAQRKTTSSFSQVLGDAAPGRRLLLRRGDVFSGKGSTADNGPGIIGAFGSGPKPRVTNNGQSDDLFRIGSDWRMMDISSSSPTSGEARHFNCGSTSVRRYILLLRVEASGGDRAFGCVEEAGRSNEDIAVVDSVFRDQKNNSHLPYSVFHVASRRNMFMGNVIGGSGGHNIRFPYARDFVFTFNYSNSSAQKANFRLHGGGGSNDTRFVVFGYNTLGPNAGGGASNINTVSSSAIDPIYDVIYEGNFYPYGHRYLNFGAMRVSARNNVLRAPNGRLAMFRIWQRGYRSGSQWSIDDLWFYNNTLVWTSNDTAKMVTMQEQDGGVFKGNAVFRNNLIYAPGRNVDAFPTGGQFKAEGNMVVTAASKNPLRASSPGTSITDYEVNSSAVVGATDSWFEGMTGSGSAGGEPQPQLAAPFLH